MYLEKHIRCRPYEIPIVLLTQLHFSKGRFHGSYSPSTDAQGNWIGNWGADSQFVRIRGRGRFDVLRVTRPGAKPEAQVRVIGDTVVDLQSIAAIQYVSTLASAFIFEGKPAFAHACGQVMRKVVDRLREEGRGAGLVVANLDPNVAHTGAWRLETKAQTKPLVAPLAELDEPILRLADQNGLGRKEVERAAEKIARLADLDGAVYLTCDEDGSVRARPARHFFPLIRGPETTELLDFYKWVKAGCQVADVAKTLRQVETILGKMATPISERQLSKLSEDEWRQKAVEHARKLKPFESLEQLYVYCAYIAGHLRKYKDQEPDSAIRRASDDLSFLTSAGTRHHSLWGITLSAKERVFVISLSHDGRVSVFWDGRLISTSVRDR